MTHRPHSPWLEFAVFSIILSWSLPVIAAEAGPAKPPKARKHISAWYGYEKGRTLDDLAPVADMISSLSICGQEPPAEFVAAVRARGIETYRLVWCDGTLAFDTPERTQATIKDHLRLCREVGFDGIDLDYESVPPKSRQLFSGFMKALSKELRAIGKKMTIAVFVPAGPPCDVPVFYDYDVIKATCDQVKVMCYDLNNAPALYAAWWTLPRHPGFGPASTAPWARDCMQWWMERIPREKLVMALPAYGNDYDASPGGKGEQIYAPVPPIPAGNASEKFWLSYEKVNVYRYIGKDAKPRIFFASDTESTKPHLKTIDTLGLTGLSFWHFQAVPKETWQAVREWVGGQ